MKNILFSIIIPTYNCENLIESTLDSIISQEKQLYECIVVDGLSSDNTIDIVKRYSDRYSNIKFVSQKDKGIYDAMNRGIDLAKGKYLYFIGAGDKLVENILFNIANEINDEDLIYGNVFLEYEKVKQGEVVRKSDLIYDLICHQAIFYKSSIFKLHGKYELKYSIGADNILNKKVFADDMLVKKYVDLDVAYYLGGGISQTYNIVNEFKNEDSFVNELIDIYGDKYLKELYQNFRYISHKKLVAWGNGGEYLKAKDIKSFEFDYFVKSYVDIQETFKNKQVKCREALLGESKDNIFIFVYSAHFYKEIRKWLEDNGYVEFKNFMLVTKEILLILKKIDFI